MPTLFTISPHVDSSRMSASTCVATVTDAAYLPGTIVLLSSFLRHNSWFTGEIVIIHDDLPGSARRLLKRFPNLRFHAVGAELKMRLAAVTAEHPHLRHKLHNFFSLEAFNLRCDRTLQLDSDLLCMGDASELFRGNEALLCCPDQPYFREQVRDRTTYAPRSQLPGETTETVLPLSFNTGVLAITPAQLGDSIYEDLLSHVCPQSWTTVQTAHTDSIVLNEYFRDAWTQLHEKYNYLVSAETPRYTRNRVPISDAVFIHLLGRPKPWQQKAGAVAQLSDEQRIAFQMWHDAWKLAT